MIEGISIPEYDKKAIVDMYKSIGEPELNHDTIMAIRRTFGYGMIAIKRIIQDYKDYQSGK